MTVSFISLSFYHLSIILVLFSLFFSLLFLVPFKYEALIDDYLNLGNSDSSKKGNYAPVYPIFRVRLPKRKQIIIEQNSDSSLDPID